MFIQYIFQYYNYVARKSFNFETQFSTQLINLAVEEVSRNKSVIQTLITYFINQKEKQVSVWHNSLLTLVKSGKLYFHIDIIHTISLDAKSFSVVCLIIYYEKLTVKTTLPTTRHFIAKEVKLLPVRHNL